MNQLQQDTITSHMGSQRPVPSSINKQFVLGPLAHYASITDVQAATMGVTRLPGSGCRCSTSGPGWTARRLKNGRLNVVLDARLLRDDGAARFVSSMQRYAAAIALPE